MKLLRRNLVASIIPAGLLAAVGVYAIVQEADRAREAESSFLETKAERAADLVSSRVRSEAESLISQIAETPSPDRAKTLEEATLSNPLVRSAYLWRFGGEGEKSGLVWTSSRYPREAFFANEQRRRMEFLSGNADSVFSGSGIPPSPGNVVLPARKYNWASVPDRSGRRIACWRCVETNVVCLVEMETVAILARIPGWLAEFGVDSPAESGRRALAAEVRDVTKGVLCPSSVKLKGTYSGEASLKGMLMPEWSVKVGWSRGDEVVAGSVGRVVLGAGSLLLLCAGWFAVSFFLFAKAAFHAHRESMEKTTFVDNVSHELKTPLASIMLYTDMLREGTLKSREDSAKALEVISSECSRLLRMVENLLDFSRLEKRRRKFAIEKVEAVGFVADTVGMVAGRFVANGINFEARGEVYVYADPDALRQILLNILDNAAKYASDGGAVDVSVSHAGGMAGISVKDRGPGLSRESAKRVFDRFWREDDSVTADVQGNGLGLSIALHLAEGMGGGIRVSTEENFGCVFTVELKGADYGENTCG